MVIDTSTCTCISGTKENTIQTTVTVVSNNFDLKFILNYNMIGVMLWFEMLK